MKDNRLKRQKTKIANTYFVFSIILLIVLMFVLPDDIMTNKEASMFVDFMGNIIPSVANAERLRGIGVALDVIPIYYAIGWGWAIVTGPVMAILGVLCDSIGSPNFYNWDNSGKTIIKHTIFPIVSVVGATLFYYYFSPAGRLNYADIPVVFLYKNKVFPIIWSLGIIFCIHFFVIFLMWLPKTIVIYKRVLEDEKRNRWKKWAGK